jgi:hypothetical protein
VFFLCFLKLPTINLKMQVVKLNLMILGALQAVGAVDPCVSANEDKREHAVFCYQVIRRTSYSEDLYNPPICEGTLDCGYIRGTGSATDPPCGVSNCVERFSNLYLGEIAPNCYGTFKCPDYQWPYDGVQDGPEGEN